MRKRAAPLVAGILLLATPAYALGGVSSIDLGFISTLLTKALVQLTQLLAIQSVRVVIALIAIFAIFYNLLDSVMGKINQLSESRKPIAIAISLLAVLAIFKTLKMETLDKLMITFAIIMVLTILFKLFMKLKGYFGSSTNHNKVIKDEKNVKNQEKYESDNINNEKKLVEKNIKLDKKDENDFEKLKDILHHEGKSEEEIDEIIRKLVELIEEQQKLEKKAT